MKTFELFLKENEKETSQNLFCESETEKEALAYIKRFLKYRQGVSMKQYFVKEKN